MPNVFDQFDVDPKQQGTPQNVFDQFDAPKEEAPGLLESFGRGVSSGASFGFDKSLGMSKERDEAARKANPWTHFAGEMAGAVAPTVAATLAAPEAVIPAGIARAAPWLEKGYAAVRGLFVPGEMATTGQALGQAAKLGTSYGTLAGAGNADVNPNDTTAQALGKRGVGAVEGGLTGLVTSPVFGWGGHKLYEGAQGIGSMLTKAGDEIAPGGKGALNTMVKGFERDRTTPQELINQIQTELPDTSAQAGASRFWGPLNGKQNWTQDQVEEVSRRALNGETAAQIEQAMRPGKGASLSINPGVQSGPGAAAIQTLMDELASRNRGPLNIIDRTSLLRPGAGENTQMTMRAARATPGDARSIAGENLLERQIGSGGRLQDLFSQTIGSPDYEGVAAKHASDLQDAGARAYAIAYANEKPFDLNPIFNKWSAKYANQRGPIPDAVNGVLNNMRTTQPVLDQAGNVVIGSGIVNKAPPMDLEGFINARQGLSDQIQSATQNGQKNLARQLTQFHGDLTDEVARTNPDWLKANQLWSDGRAAQDALDAGANMSTRLNASSRENLKVFNDAQSEAKQAASDLADAKSALKKQSKANPTQLSQLQAAVEGAQARLDAANTKQELFKVGLVRALSDQIQNQGETHNLTRQLMLPGAKKILSQVLGPNADQFHNAVAAESAMNRTYASQFGSQTTPLREAVEELNWAPQVEAMSLNPLHWGAGLANLAAKYAAQGINARRNSELMNMYTETNPLKQLDLLRQAQALHQTRSQFGNAVGKPALSAVAPFNALLEDQPSPNRPAPAVEPYQP